jgi:hypothetical protein
MSPTCHLWTADANSHMSCHANAAPMPRCAVALKSRFQNGMVVAWHGRGMACVNQTRPHCVNQIGKTQSKPLVERHGHDMGTACYVWISLYSLPAKLHKRVNAVFVGFLRGFHVRYLESLKL